MYNSAQTDIRSYKHIVADDNICFVKNREIEIADKVTVQLMATDPDLSPRKQLVKSSEKNGLYLAMDIADIWLERALANKI